MRNEFTLLFIVAWSALQRLLANALAILVIFFVILTRQPLPEDDPSHESQLESPAGAALVLDQLLVLPDLGVNEKYFNTAFLSVCQAILTHFKRYVLSEYLAIENIDVP